MPAVEATKSGWQMMAVSQSWKQIRDWSNRTSNIFQRWTAQSEQWRLEDIGSGFKEPHISMVQNVQKRHSILSESFQTGFRSKWADLPQVTPPRPPVVLPKYQRFSGDHMPHSRCGGAWNSLCSDYSDYSNYSVLMSSKIIVALKNALTSSSCASCVARRVLVHSFM